ncbi:protein neprosin-like [Silene latifolia]|uniref:protein neprosin-like n=1 Tax=Silene latifolia TaxID=37657 RepID=UPI003D775ED8
MFIQKLAFLLTLCSFLIVHGVRDVQLSMQEEKTALDKEFQQLQKPTIKTIQDELEDTYDCVDFYKQPAFDHPLLKNHTFYPEMKPSSTSENSLLACNRFMNNMKLKDGGCPKGTVPIRRINKDEFYQIKKFTKEYSRYNNNALQPLPGTHIAIVQTNSDPSTTTYYGVGGELNVYDLSIKPSQYSSGEFIIQNGDDRIKVGWTAGQSHCFNALCPGFVHTKGDVPIDGYFSPTSKRGAEPSFFDLRIHQDANTGHWWLEVCGIPIGFWPKEIFSTMSTSATYVAVGGEVYSPPNQPLPPMGNGYYPVNDITRSAYCTNFVVLNQNLTPINPENTETLSDDYHYGVYDEGITKHMGRVVYFGGTTMWK